MKCFYVFPKLLFKIHFILGQLCMHKMDVSSKGEYISNMYLMKICVGRSKEIDKPYGRMILII